MIYFPNAKINIGLNVVEKRVDGYHNIETIFYPIDLCDILEIRKNEKSKTDLSIFGINIDESISNNLCIKAYNLLNGLYPQIKEVDICLYKNIPLGAGLGGGSSDASFTLKLLNYIFSLNLTNNQLIELSKQLGADCAFFIENKPVFAYHKGDEFENVDLNLKGKYLLLIKPDLFISTQEAYSNITPQKTNLDIREIIKTYPIKEWKNYLKNDFELSLSQKYKEFPEIKQALYDLGADYASLSGSGATMYGIFEKEISQKIINSINYPFVRQIKL